MFGLINAWRGWLGPLAAAQLVLLFLRWMGVVSWPWWALLTPVWIFVAAIVTFGVSMLIWWPHD